MRVLVWIPLLLGSSFVLRTIRAQETRCFCARCNDDILNSLAEGVPCVERIDYLIGLANEDYTERDACIEVSEDHPDVCGPQCHPIKCQEDEPDYCGCFSCDDEALDLIADGPSCRSRIRAVQQERNFTEIDACQVVTEEFFLECGPACNPDKCDGKKPAHCGCNACDNATLLTIAPSPTDFPTCYERIKSARQEFAMTELAACEFVAENFPR